MSAVRDSVQTVNAAAAAIVTSEARAQPPSFSKRRWGSFWSKYWCFKSNNRSKTLNHAALVPEPVIVGATVALTSEALSNSTTVNLPFVVPPSSPASFLQSEPPSATQTPGGPLSANDYSPPSTFIYTTGPYAHEKQLVSPPVFSTFTTQPSTASFTPPLESVQPTNPSSPDVPFSKKLLLSQYDFEPYQGSPISNLISPGSVVSNSGTSSPYLDKNFSLKFHVGEVPKVLELEDFCIRKWGSRLGSGMLTPQYQIADEALLANADNDMVTDHRVSFGLNREDVVQCLGKNSVSEQEGGSKKTEEDSPRKSRAISFGSFNEFDFDNSRGESSEKSGWWADEKIIGGDLDSQNNWTFFPELQSKQVQTNKAG